MVDTRHINLLNERRFWVASGGAVWVLAAVMVVGQLASRSRPAPAPVQRTMELVIEALQLPPQISPPETATPQGAALAARKPEQTVPREIPRVEPAQPLQAQPLPQSPAQPVASAASSASPAVPETLARAPMTQTATPAAPAPSAQVDSPRPVLPPAPPAPQAASVESEFVAQLRAQLNASKRYPTGREASMQRPSGRVVVWFVLNRSGQLQETGVAESSNSILLDNAALTTVRRASFPSWPESAWVGQPTHRFTATLEFIPLS